MVLMNEKGQSLATSWVAHPALVDWLRLVQFEAIPKIATYFRVIKFFAKTSGKISCEKDHMHFNIYERI
jgi:hypothetical protein